MIRPLRFVLAVTGAAVFAWPAAGAILGLDGDHAEFQPDALQVPVRLVCNRGESVAGFQFDLRYDPETLSFAGATPGPESAVAEKSAHANEIRPGFLRVVVAGFNRNAIASGEVVRVAFNRLPVTGGQTPIQMANPVLSDPDGAPLAVTASPDTLLVHRDSAVASGASGGPVSGARGQLDLLYRYRALLFAAVVVALTMLLARTKPKKGRVR